MFRIILQHFMASISVQALLKDKKHIMQPIYSMSIIPSVLGIQKLFKTYIKCKNMILHKFIQFLKNWKISAMEGPINVKFCRDVEASVKNSAALFVCISKYLFINNIHLCKLNVYSYIFINIFYQKT